MSGPGTHSDDPPPEDPSVASPTGPGVERPPANSGSGVDIGGDPVCWAPRVCPECGLFVPVEPPTVCPRCGAAVGIE